MSSSVTSTADLTLRQRVVGSRRFSNFWWAIIVSLGGGGFLLASISSYTKINFLPLSDPTVLVFVPQGIAMGFYGVAGCLLALYLWLVIAWDVGGGFNEFDKKSQIARVFRWGFPGKNRQIEVSHPLEDIQSIRVVIKDGLNPQRALYLKIKGKGEIPLTRVGQPLPLTELENQGAELARFLSVPLEGL